MVVSQYGPANEVGRALTVHARHHMSLANVDGRLVLDVPRWGMNSGAHTVVLADLEGGSPRIEAEFE